MNQVKQIQKDVDLKGNKYEVGKVNEYDAIQIVIDVEASLTIPAKKYVSEVKFPNKFLLNQIIVHSETNALAGFLLVVNNQQFPSKVYFSDSSNNMKTIALGSDAKGFYSTTTPTHYRDLYIEIDANNKIEFLVYNSHSSAQKLYITLLGFNIYEMLLNQLK